MSSPEDTAVSPPARRKIAVTGIVQGVGFRPFIYGLARRHALAGHVGNNSAGVFIEIEGSLAALDAFLQDIKAEAPPLAYIESITVTDVPASGEAGFVIVHSESSVLASTLLSPDVCVCEDCLRETLDPGDRRYRYPFTNCTNCGPRFTIIQDIPYDRPFTSMAAFKMCPECQSEYDDPLNRRFHAQPNACPICGPHVWLEMAGGAGEIVAERDDALAAVQELLAAGKIVAIKGLGGFHLACDATNDGALALLRERKGRVDKPFAVMARDLQSIQQFAELSDEEIALLTSKERPIVLLKKKKSNALSQLIAPGNPLIGVMLPYTPLHQVLLNDIEFRIGVLVMTSGNFSDEPIVRQNESARRRLGHLADAFLMHNRDIVARCDDSVIRVRRGQELPVRRSRGYAPFPVKLPFEVPPLLAVGGELKAMFCLAQDQFAYLSQHIGDMENLETLYAFESAVHHYEHIFRVEPQFIACDMHPNYLSTRWALEQQTHKPVIQVQHHHAHIAAVMAEHQLPEDRSLLGFSFDGTGYGVDGAIWGGEVLIADYRGFERAAHLNYVPLPGGDAAIKRPYRLALANLWAAGIAWDERLASVRACPEAERAVLKRQLETNLNTVPTSSMGRLFDAIASLAGVRQVVTYEAQAAIELEALAVARETSAYHFDYDGSQFDAVSVIKAAAADALAGVSPHIISARFHNAVAALILEISLEQRRKTGLNQVALSGGVFQNVTLLESAVQRLEGANFDVLVHRRVPPNDGGLALGQAVIAAANFVE